MAQVKQSVDKAPVKKKKPPKDAGVIVAAPTAATPKPSKLSALQEKANAELLKTKKNVAASAAAAPKQVELVAAALPIPRPPPPVAQPQPIVHAEQKNEKPQLQPPQVKVDENPIEHRAPLQKNKRSRAPEMDDTGKAKPAIASPVHRRRRGDLADLVALM